jgi:arylsulfatase A-like enzyme
MRILNAIFLVIAILTSSLRIEAKEKADDPPNVIFIICDDLNDYQGVFGGHPQAITPNMDALAASGVQFLNAASNAPVCMPSRNSIFTGVYPHDSKDFGWTGRTKQPVLKFNKPIMQLFKENGYYMAGSGKLIHEHEPALWDSWGMNKKHNYGPLYFDGTNTGAHPGVPSPYREIGAIDGSYGSFASAGISSGVQGQPGFVYGNDLTPFRYVTDNDRDLMQDEKHAQWAVEKLQQFESENLAQPFFLGLGFVKPHTPLHAPQKYYDMYPLEDLVLADWLEGDEMDTYYRDNFPADRKGLRYYRTILESYDNDRELALKSFLQAYLACVTFVDDQIGKVMDGLDKSVYKENTIVILTSDHGWQMGEKQYLFKNSAWEESARVPLVIRTPDSSPGGKAEHPVSLVDLYPTLVDYCELEGDHKTSEAGAILGGNSLRPFIEDPEAETWEGPEGALTIIGNGGKTIGVLDQNYALRTKDWRYILYGDGSEELYDHRTDPNEWYNLAYKADHLTIKKALKEKLLQMLPSDVEVEALFMDDFEQYTPGEDLEKASGFQLWGGNANVYASEDASGHGPYEGKQYALTTPFWAALVAPFTLSAGRKYQWSVASKVEVENSADNANRARKIEVNSGDHVYLSVDVDQTVDDWVVTNTEFTIEEGLEDVTLKVIGPTSFPMGVDNFFLFDESPYLKLYYDGEIIEEQENGETITLILHKDSYANPLNLSSWTVEGLPEGIAVGNLQRADSSMAQFDLLGNSSQPYEGTDVVGLSVTVGSDQFSTGKQDLSIYDDVVFRALDTTSVELSPSMAGQSFKVYPNPAISSLNIIHEGSSNGHLELLSMAGRKLLSRPLETPHMRIDLPKGLNGIYLLRLFSFQSVLTQKVMIYS